MSVRRRVAAVLAIASVMSAACGSSPLDRRADGPVGGDRSDLQRLDEVGTGDACRSLDDVRRLGERYNEVVDHALFDAVQIAEDDPTVERDEVALEALREMLIELDPVAVDLIDALRDTADAAPDLADDLEVLADFMEAIMESWQQLLERPDADPGELLDAFDDGDEREHLRVLYAIEHLKEAALDECGLDLFPDE